QVGLELRQLPGAAHAVRVDEIGRVYLRIAVLLGVHIEHELRDRAVQAREPPLHQRESRAGDLGGRVEVELLQPSAEIRVAFRLKGELPRRADSSNLGVFLRRFPKRYIGIRNVGDLQKKILQLRLNDFELPLQFLQLPSEFLHLLHDLRGELLIPLRLRLSDLLRLGVALRLVILGLGLNVFSLRLEFLECRRVEVIAPRSQSLSDAIEVVAQQLNVQHGNLLKLVTGSSFFLLCCRGRADTRASPGSSALARDRSARTTSPPACPRESSSRPPRRPRARRARSGSPCRSRALS